MKVTIYLDVIFIINFTADWFVLWLTGIFLGQRIKIGRLFLGALFSSALLLPFLCIPDMLTGCKGVLVMTGISMGTIVISFGGRSGSLIKKWFLSTTIMFLLGGILYCLKEFMGLRLLSLYNWFLLFAAGGVLCTVLFHGLKSISGQADNIYDIRIRKADKSVRVKAFLDTGNMLWDALYQKPVILLGEEAARKCLSREEDCFLDTVIQKKEMDYDAILNMNTQRKCIFHRVRYQSVGNENGWLLCFLADEVWVEKGRHLYRQPIAVAPPFLFRGKDYQGLLHKSCI